MFMDSSVQLFSKDCSSAEASAREARHLQTLRGPGIVPLQSAGPHGLKLNRAACSLADVVQARGSLAEDEVRAVGAAAATALARVHDAGLVHADVKPANLLLSHEGDLWLADFDATCPADGRPLKRFSPNRLKPGTLARFGADLAALALALVELSAGIVLDPTASWRAADLRRLGCSPALSAELSFMLGGDGTLNAPRAAQMLAQGAADSLPAPVANVRRVDSTPTVEFMPARPEPPPPPNTGVSPTRWCQRLAAAWRPGARPQGSSQASRSS